MRTLFTLAFIGLLLSSCSKKNDATPEPHVLDATNVAIHYDEKHQFTVSQAGIEVNGNTITWASSDQSVASVGTNGLLIAKKIGTVTITASASGFNLKSTVTVLPYSTMCKEPYFEEGATIATTKGREFRTLFNENATGLLYNGENAKLRNAMYLFKDSKMTSAALLLATTNDVIAESATFYKERYSYLGTENGVYFYGDGNTLVIGISLDQQIGLNAIYIKGNGKTLSLTPVIEQQFKTLKADIAKRAAIQ